MKHKGSLVLGIALMVALVLMTGVYLGTKLRRHFVLIPFSQAPGYTFIYQGVTYQVRPIKARMTIYVGPKADSCYQAMMKIEDANP